MNEDFLVVDRVLAMDYQDDGDYALVKWKYGIDFFTIAQINNQRLLLNALLDLEV